MLKAYKFRLYPNKIQREYFIKTFGCVRFVYNKMLEERIRLYEELKLNPDAKQKLPTPAMYKDEFPFLKEVDALALCNAQMDLNKAYSNFFETNQLVFLSLNRNELTEIPTQSIVRKMQYVSKTERLDF